MNQSLLFIFFILLITTKISSFSSGTISYSQHCNDFAHEAIPTDKVDSTTYLFLEPVTSHYTGGQNILDHDPPLQRSIYFVPTPNLFKTNINDTYKIQARLIFYLSDISNVSHGNNLVFDLEGFWSLSTNMLCMVGSATWYSKQDERVSKIIRLDAVLKLKFARFISLRTSLVSGILESLVSPDDPNYFQPISMLGFPRVAPFHYNYTLTSNELTCNKSETRQDSVTSMQTLNICSLFTRRFNTYILKYPSNCNNNCSLFDGDLPIFVSLYAIQCSREGKKARFLVELFNDRRFTPYDKSFDPNLSLIGEATWSGTKDEVCIVACRILNQSDPLGGARVGDCSIRLTLWFPATRCIKRTHTTEGQIFWGTNVTFEFQSFDHSLENYGRKYEYTQIEKARQICPNTRRVLRGKYKFGDYKFDMSVKYNKNMVSSGYAVPIFVGDQVYNINMSRHYKVGRLNISYEVSFRLDTISTGILSLLSSINDGKVEISAEGVYDGETGQICMVGCRNLNLYSKMASFDCEIMVKFQLYSQGNGSFIKGSIESLRGKQDVLFFEKLDIVSVTYTETEARKAIWRMDFEMIMVLVSDTLSCVFIAQQLYHFKKRRENVSFVSVLTMLILTLGHLVPLLLNTRVHKNLPFGNGQGWLQLNEGIVVRIMSMAAFVLQFCLLQLTWTKKKNNQWVHEIWTMITYISIGSIVVFLVNWKKSSNFSNHLGSFAGLIVDGFLLPQIVLNIFQISKANAALSYTFYIGTTFVRLLPHVYDLSRGPKSIGRQFDRFYIYANPRADLYTPSWDIAIVCAGVVFAVILFLQQRFGGRFMLSKRFQESVEYEMVPVLESN
ncbi:uncharacterized protein [Rutidosis leptorrhynchoides]|uniref:uncharacterized protein n=1 Tax=Rutidosis leptorrhynchoides TaxID=125765 RepID=UPI003A99242D